MTSPTKANTVATGTHRSMKTTRQPVSDRTKNTLHKALARANEAQDKDRADHIAQVLKAIKPLPRHAR